jgi:hypothetical protein
MESLFRVQKTKNLSMIEWTTPKYSLPRIRQRTSSCWLGRNTLRMLESASQKDWKSKPWNTSGFETRTSPAWLGDAGFKTLDGNGLDKPLQLRRKQLRINWQTPLLAVLGLTHYKKGMHSKIKLSCACAFISFASWSKNHWCSKQLFTHLAKEIVRHGGDQKTIFEVFEV